MAQPSGDGIYVGSGNPFIDYNCVWGNGDSGNKNYYNWSAGTNDISSDPQFIGLDDFHLRPYSPCIDVGSNTTPGIPETDKDGNPRIVRIVDMGDYEFQGTPTPTYILITPTSRTVGIIIRVLGEGFAPSELVQIDFGITRTITVVSPIGI